MQEVSWLPDHVVRGYPMPQAERMSTVRGGQHQQVILIGITASKRHTESPLLEDLREIPVSLGPPCWGLPHPLVQPLKQNHTEKGSAANPTHPFL